MTETLIGLLSRLSEADGPALLPGRLARNHFGPHFDRLLHDGVITELTRFESWPPCRNCECNGGRRAIETVSERLVACCPLDHNSDDELEPDDLRQFEISRKLLAGTLCKASEPSELLTGLWMLPEPIAGRDMLLVFQRSVVENADMPAVLRARHIRKPVLLAPVFAGQTLRRLQDAEVCHVPLADALDTDAAGNISISADPVVQRLRSGFIRLEVREREKRVFVDGAPQDIPAQPFRLLAILARHLTQGRGAVEKREIENETRRGAADLVRDLKKALSKGRKTPGDLNGWIACDRNNSGYRLNLDPEDVLYLS